MWRRLHDNNTCNLFSNNSIFMPLAIVIAVAVQNANARMDPACNSIAPVTITDPVGIIRDHDESQEFTENGRTCKWIVDVDDADIIRFVFTTYELGDNDVLKVYRGASPSANNLIRWLSGPQFDDPVVIPIYQNKAYLELTTGNDPVPRRGIDIEYTNYIPTQVPAPAPAPSDSSPLEQDQPSLNTGSSLSLVIWIVLMFCTGIISGMVVFLAMERRVRSGQKDTTMAKTTVRISHDELYRAQSSVSKSCSKDDVKRGMAAEERRNSGMDFSDFPAVSSIV